eukprot:2726361-Karenia_brevis.AAC.1
MAAEDRELLQQQREQAAGAAASAAIPPPPPPTKEPPPLLLTEKHVDQHCEWKRRQALWVKAQRKERSGVLS